MPLTACSKLSVFILELTQQVLFNSNASVRQIFVPLGRTINTIVNFKTFSCSQEIYSCYRSHEGRVFSVVDTRNCYIIKYVMNSGEPLEESYRVILCVCLLFPKVATSSHHPIAFIVFTIFNFYP